MDPPMLKSGTQNKWKKERVGIQKSLISYLCWGLSASQGALFINEIQGYFQNEMLSMGFSEK